LNALIYRARHEHCIATTLLLRNKAKFRQLPDLLTETLE